MRIAAAGCGSGRRAAAGQKEGRLGERPDPHISAFVQSYSVAAVGTEPIPGILSILDDLLFEKFNQFEGAHAGAHGNGPDTVLRLRGNFVLPQPLERVFDG